MAGRKKDAVWNGFLEKKSSSGKGTGTRAICKRCGQEMQGLVQRLQQHVDKKCKYRSTAQMNELVVTAPSKSIESLGITSDQNRDLELSGKSGNNTGNFLPASETISNTTSSNYLITCKTCASDKKCSQHSSAKQTEKTESVSVPNQTQVRPSGVSVGVSMNTFVIKTDSGKKHELDKQIARAMFATNTSFRCIEHPQVKKALGMLRPGYEPPSRSDISGRLLDEIYAEQKEYSLSKLENQFLCMSLDGWSNIHREPIVCITVTNEDGKVFLVESLDTSGKAHTATFLINLAKEAIHKCETDYKCYIRSFVTDNAANMTKMRNELAKEQNVLSFGCSAHFLHLLSKDLESVSGIKIVKEHITCVVKYFRNTHFAAAKYKEEGGNKLILPQDVRWNSFADCIEAYVVNWSKLLKICEENKNDVDRSICEKVMNMGIKKSAEDLLKILKPISVALDRAQRNDCTIAEAVEIWKELERNLKNVPVDEKQTLAFKKRYEEAILPSHLLAYILDPRLNVFKLSPDERVAALEFAEKMYPNTGLLPIVIKLESESSPFARTMFTTEILRNVSALQWWNSQKQIPAIQDLKPIICQLFTARASSSGVERIFSSFGLVHSKLRNRLGTEKAAKLTFLFKDFNESSL